MKSSKSLEWLNMNVGQPKPRLKHPFLSPMVMVILRLKKYFSDNGEMNDGKNDGNGAGCCAGPINRW